MKLNYGETYPQLASKRLSKLKLSVVEPVEVTEILGPNYFSSVKRASLNKSNKIWKRRHLLDAGVVLLWLVEMLFYQVSLKLAKERILGVRVAFYVKPSGIHNPAFAHVSGFVRICWKSWEVNVWLKELSGENQVLRQQPVKRKKASGASSQERKRKNLQSFSTSEAPVLVLS